MKRRLFLASSMASLGLAGCGPAKDALTNGPFRNVLLSTEHLNRVAIGTRGMARLYSDAMIDRQFRTNGLDTPTDSAYDGLRADDFRSYRLIVEGRVDHPLALSTAQLRAAGTITQTTRHDCVEGWSAVGKWTGVPLATVLAMAKPASDARYCVFRCFDRDSSGQPYYESLDLHQAAHPQTQLALDLNGAPLDADHGAPVRLRIPTQLGYKSAKWVSHIALVTTLAGLYGGSGGYWEDQGYEWYAGI